MTTTPNLNLTLPDFNDSPWHDDVNGNFRAIDAVIKSLFGIDNLLGAYVNSTAVTTGQRFYDSAAGIYYEAQSDFTTMASPNTFETERSTYPTRWAALDAAEALVAATDAETAKDAAETAQAAAEAAEANAATSETNAATSETNAATSETNAATSETNAAVSETNAATSETNAAASAASAALAATNLGWGYAFNSSTSAADPGSAKLSFDNATLMSATTLYINETANEGLIDDIIASWDDSNNPIKATIHIRVADDVDNWFNFDITGAATDNGDYWSVPITPVQKAGTITNSDVLLVAVQKDSALGNNVVLTTHIADGNITTAKIAANAVDDTKIAADAVTTAKVVDSNITTAKIADGAVTTAKMANDAVPVDLGSTDTGKGASLIGVEDVNSWFSGTDQEAVNNQLYKPLLHLQDIKAANTSGGTSVVGRQTRTITDKLVDEIGSTLSSNTFTLPAGTYDADIITCSYASSRSRAYLYNVTDTADELVGLSRYVSISGDDGAILTVSGRFTIAGTKTFRIELYAASAQSIEGLGVEANDSSDEIYTDVKIRKVA